MIFKTGLHMHEKSTRSIASHQIVEILSEALPFRNVNKKHYRWSSVRASQQSVNVYIDANGTVIAQPLAPEASCIVYVRG